MKNIKRWTVVFRTLSNINRLKIIGILSSGRKMNVGDIARSVGISQKSASNHLAILKNLDVLESHGNAGHVFYFINSQMPKDFSIVLRSL